MHQANNGFQKLKYKELDAKECKIRSNKSRSFTIKEWTLGTILLVAKRKLNRISALMMNPLTRLNLFSLTESATSYSSKHHTVKTNILISQVKMKRRTTESMNKWT